jgi:hypothetical protein
MVIFDIFDDFHGFRGWPEIAINQAHFLFSAYSLDIIFDHAALYHQFQGLYIINQMLNERLALLLIKLAVNYMLAHRYGN